MRNYNECFKTKINRIGDKMFLSTKPIVITI